MSAPRRGPFKRELQTDTEQPNAENLERNRRRYFDNEMERRELKQRIEAEVSVHARHVDVEHDFGVRPELRRIRRHCEIGLGADARDISVQNADCDAPWTGKRQRRRIKARMKTAGRDHEIAVFAPGDE